MTAFAVVGDWRLCFPMTVEAGSMIYRTGAKRCRSGDETIDPACCGRFRNSVALRVAEGAVVVVLDGRVRKHDARVARCLRTRDYVLMLVVRKLDKELLS